MQTCFSTEQATKKEVHIHLVQQRIEYQKMREMCPLYYETVKALGKRDTMFMEDGLLHLPPVEGSRELSSNCNLDF